MINEQKKNYYFKTLSRISGISFTRAICTIGIVFYHYFSRSKGTFKLLRKTANSTWGFIFVTTFFCISGTVLYYNYPKIYSLKKFYYKRWKSIFPPFYICYFYFFLTEAFNSHKLFSRGHWTKIIYTLLGIDGYLSYKIKTYYLVGEWFLGAIIILYTYSIYLFHHHIIHDIQNLYNPEKWYLHLLLLTATLVLSIICAKIHFMTNKCIIQNIIFQKMDSFFLS